MQHRPGQSGGRGGGFGGGPRDGAPSGGSQQTPLLARLRDQQRITYTRPSQSNTAKPAPRPELFDEEALAVAQKLAGIKASQLRRFFGAVQTLKRKLQLDGRLDLEFIKGEMALLKAKSGYMLQRLHKGDEDAWDLLTLLVRHGRSIENRDDFFTFARHFEAVMAYHKMLSNER